MLNGRYSDGRTAMIPYYRLLRLERTATSEEIKRAYHQLARKYHPDHHDGHPKAEDRFRLIAEAYGVLSDPDKRKNYDRFGAAGLVRAGSNGGMAEKMGRLVSELGTILESRINKGPKRGKDRRISLEVSLEEVLTGTQRTIAVLVRAVCSECNGSRVRDGAQLESCHVCAGKGRVRGSRPLPFNELCVFCEGMGSLAILTCAECDGVGEQDSTSSHSIDVPAGVQDGRCLVLRGYGEPGHQGGDDGDLFVEIRLHKDEWRTRDGLDIHCIVPIRLNEAVYGGEIEVPTLDGKTVRVIIPKGVQSGKIMRLKGRGLSLDDSKTSGDMFIQLRVEVPILMKEGKKALDQLEKVSTYPKSDTYTQAMKKRLE